MKNDHESRIYHADIAARWIQKGDKAHLLERQGDAYAIRSSSGELAQIDTHHFLHCLGIDEEQINGWTGYDLAGFLADAGLAAYAVDAGVIVLDLGNPLLNRA